MKEYPIESESLRLHISTHNGDISITGSENSQLQVSFPELRKNAAEDLFDITFEDNTLFITQIKEKLSEFIDAEQYPVEVSVPASCKVGCNIKTMSGSIKGSGLPELSGRFKSRSGNITLVGPVKGELHLQSISGDVLISHAEGAVTASSISGDINAAACSFGATNLRSVSGDIDATGHFSLAEEGVFKTVSGDICLDFSSCSDESLFSIKTVSGEVQLNGNKPPEERIKISRVSSALSEAYPVTRDYFRNIAGKIMKSLKPHVKRASETVVRTKTAASAEAASSHDVQTILNMVSEGKISVDDAEKLIRAIKGRD